MQGWASDRCGAHDLARARCAGSDRRRSDGRARLTERQRSVDDLRRSQERLRRAEIVVHMGSSEWDLATNRVHGHRACARSSNPSPRSRARMSSPASAIASIPVIASCRRAPGQARSGMGSISIEYRAIRSDGHVRVFNWRADTIVDDEGNPTRVIEVVHDVAGEPQGSGRRGKRAAGIVLPRSRPWRDADAQSTSLHAVLTAKQLEVLGLISHGLTNAGDRQAAVHRRGDRKVARPADPRGRTR